MQASAAATYCRGMPHMRDLLLPLLRPPGALSQMTAGKQRSCTGTAQMLLVGQIKAYPRPADDAALFCILCTSAGLALRMSRSKRSLHAAGLVSVT